MAVKLKTRPIAKSVSAFLASIPDAERRRDCKIVAKMMREVTGATPKMWGPSIVAYGDHHFRYASGREVDWFHTGFSPRKQSLTLYIMPGFKRYGPLMKRLGKHSTGVSCLYIKRLSDIDLRVLRQLIAESVRHMKRADA